VREAADGLRTIGDLRRGLELKTNWRVEDQRVKAEIGRRFQRIISGAVKSRNPQVRLAVANLIADIGTNIGAVEPLSPTTGKFKKDGGRIPGRAKSGVASEDAGKVKTKGEGQPDVANPPDRSMENEEPKGEGPLIWRYGFAQTFFPEVVRLIRDRDPQVRTAAIRALGKINPPPDEALSELQNLVGRQSDTRQRRAAAGAFVDLIREAAGNKTTQARAVSITLEEGVDLALRIVPLAVKGLEDSDGMVRRLCATAIEEAAGMLSANIPKRETSYSSEGGTKKPKDSTVSFEDTISIRHLAGALAKHGSDLADVLKKDPDAGVRYVVLRALGKMANAHWALAQLEGIGGPPRQSLAKGLKPTVKVLSRSIADPRVELRLAALNVLEALEAQAEPAAGALVAALDDQNQFVRWQAARILKKIGKPVPKAVPGLARMLASDVELDLRKQAVATLETYGPDARGAVPALIQAARAEDPAFLMTVFRAFSAIGKKAIGQNLPQVVKTLTGALGDSDARVRMTAAEILGSFGRGARAAVGALREAQKDDDVKVRTAASEALISIEE
jgi:HEAT repeat protein